VRRILIIAILSALVSVIAPEFISGAAPLDCGETTLEGQVVRRPDGTLECAPGQPIVTREDLVAAGDRRADRRIPLAAFFTIADLQLPDEESPVRAEFTDKCDKTPFGGSGFRPHETMVPHLMNAHIRAANRIASDGTPVLGVPYNFAVGLGDLADNQQYNEVRLFIDIFDGGQLVDPDSGRKNESLDVLDDFPGGDDYDGVQDADPEGGQPPLTSPLSGNFNGQSNSMLNLANEPFLAPGLRNADGTPLPWYSVMGNHDVKVQGTAPDDDPAWRALMRQLVVGHFRINEPLNPEEQQALCTAFETQDADLFRETLERALTSPTIQRSVVPSDPDRRLLDKIDWINEHADTTGLPAGHGFLPEDRRCPAGPPPAALAPEPNAQERHRRGCYSWIDGAFHYVALDTNPLEGLENGNVDDAQIQWLEQQLISSSSSYFDASGALSSNPTGVNRYVVVFAHHPFESLTNPGYPGRTEFGSPEAPGVHTDEDLRALLLRFPNVILLADGHTHKNKIWSWEDETKGTGFWEVNTSAVADYPTHSRTIEIADNRDGTLSIFAVVFDAAAPPNPRDLDWTAGDPTDETLAGAARQINEEWLASAGREVLFNDPQQDPAKIGSAEDRNVELIIKNPIRCDSTDGKATRSATCGRGSGKGKGAGGPAAPQASGPQTGAASDGHDQTQATAGVDERQPSLALILLVALVLAGAALWLVRGSRSSAESDRARSG
jgi:metallophosphoesterase (TIGR03767 family)